MPYVRLEQPELPHSVPQTEMDSRLNADKAIAAERLVVALSNLIDDLELRSSFKLGDDKGVVDCGNGV